MKWMISMVSNSVTTREISPFEWSLTPFSYYKQWNRAEWYSSQIFPRILVLAFRFVIFLHYISPTNLLLWFIYVKVLIK